MRKIMFMTMLVILSLGVFAQAVITPDNPKDADDLTCTYRGSTSNLIFKWFIGEDEKASGSFLSNTATSPSQTWTCRVYTIPSRYGGSTKIAESSAIIEDLPNIPSIIDSGTGMPDLNPIPPNP